LNLKKDEVYQRDLSTLTRPCSVLNLEGKIKINQLVIKSFCATTLENESILSIVALEAGALLLIL
jgi:hypothetical protein